MEHATRKNLMLPRRYKAGVFVLAALNTVATTWYFNYLFFFLRDQFGFGNRGNLWVSALHGFVYIFSAWKCGQFAQRRGYLTSLKFGFAALTLISLVGAVLDSLTGQMCVVFAYSIALLLIWPALEALATDGESRQGVQWMVGIYNCTWASGAALAFFCGGRLYDALGKGAVFVLPALLFFTQLLLALWLERQAKSHAVEPAKSPAVPEPPPHPEARAFQQPVNPRTFLRMAWLANPFAYVAINTLFAVMPAIGTRLGLSTTQVGLFCSVWLFGRFSAFVVLWRWSGWHYRFRWMLAGFVGLLASFLAIVLAHSLWIVVVAQLLFGFATGMAYYSSLFYSMDAGDAKGEHGGLHEAAIGAGICGGPLIGALALSYAPNSPNAGVWAVAGLLFVGLLGLLWLRLRKAS
jgi:predicted MFS family arabinose efflux permease